MGKLGAFTVLVMFASIMVGTFVYLSSRPSGGRGDATGFDVAEVAEPKPVVVAAPEPAPAADPSQGSPKPVIGYADEPEVASSPAPVAGGVGPGPRAGSSASPAAAGPDSDARRREKDFLAKNGAAIAKYHAGLGNIAMNHFRKNPVVRDVDRAFAGMSRYMAVKKRFDKDRDPYSFARDAIALPEVRAEIMRRAKDPAVWGAAISMVSEALKNPPPPALYGEAQRFMIKDDAVAGFVTDFMGAATSNVGAIAKGIPPGTDLAPLTKLAQDVAPGSIPAMPAMPGAPKKR